MPPTKGNPDMNTETTTPQVEPNAKPASKAKVKKAAAPADVVQDGPFALARSIFWRDPKQDRATFLAACAEKGMNVATAKTRWFCLTTGRDASCTNEKLRGV